MNGEDVKQDDVAAGDNVNFKLTSTVPEELEEYLDYSADDPVVVEPHALGDAGKTDYMLTFHDTMDEELINPRDFAVKIGDYTLQEDQYTLTTEDLADSCDFEIELNLTDLYVADVFDESDFGITPITVTYTATLDEDATAGSYNNTAWVVANGTESEKSVVTVNTYAINIYKYDQSTEDKAPLSGATFELYQKDSEDKVIEDSVVTLTSDKNGYAKADGLDAGVYYVKETEAPDGFVKSNTEVKVDIPSLVDQATNIATVNFANSPIPHTGGMGTTMFTVGGAAILAAAGVLFVTTRRKES